MEQEMEMRVWERVSGAGQEVQPDLRGMELRCREQAAVLRILAESCPNELRERLLKLQRQVHNDAMALRGMRILAGEEPEKLRNYAAGKVALRRGLAQCFRRCCQARADYLGCVRHKEHGPVFAAMAQEEARRMAEILALIGMAT